MLRHPIAAAASARFALLGVLCAGGTAWVVTLMGSQIRRKLTRDWMFNFNSAVAFATVAVALGAPILWWRRRGTAATQADGPLLACSHLPWRRQFTLRSLLVATGVIGVALSVGPWSWDEWSEYPLCHRIVVTPEGTTALETIWSDGQRTFAEFSMRDDRNEGQPRRDQQNSPEEMNGSLRR